MTSMTAQEVFGRRLQIVVAGLGVLSVVLLVRLVTIQFQMDPEEIAYFRAQRVQYVRLEEYRPTRGQIYDRDGELLAVNALEYEIGADLPFILDPEGAARSLGPVLNQRENDLYNILTADAPWALLARPVSAGVGQAVQELDLVGIQLEPISVRRYPQGMLGAQLLGFVTYEQTGRYGVEGNYDRDLAGQSLMGEESEIPFEIGLRPAPRHGRDLVLTIDRDVQFLAESELLRAIDITGAERGTIIIMDPRTGEVLAMASFPSFDPNAYYEVVDAGVLVNPAISEQYEPGSVFKVVTMAAAIEEGAILPNSTYNDQGYIECAGAEIYNWDRATHGSVDMTYVLVNSLNVGTSTIAMEMGSTRFYRQVRSFGFGQPTRVDLQGEAAGTLAVPGDAGWLESQLCFNSFGQGLAVTPLQMLTAVNAIANDGLMMQPHVVYQIIDGSDVYLTQPSPMGRPISAETARLVRDMMVQVVEYGATAAQVPGYTIAGKTGTAQIPMPGGYEEGDRSSIVTFVGFLPADDPQVSILIKLDRPDGYWGSVVVAPIFAHLAERLVLLLEIPPDSVRHQLAAQGGNLGAVDR